MGVQEEMTNINPVLLDALTAEEAYNLGIIPLNEKNVGLSFRQILEGMPPDEARRARRKFRKLWRSLSRRASQGTSEAFIRGADEAHRLGLGQPDPNKVNYTARKISVFWELRRRARKRAAGD